MKKKFIPQLVVAISIALVLISVMNAVAAGNIVPVTRIGQQINAVTANALKPTDCSSVNLTVVVICTGGNCDGTGTSELILGTAGGERIRGRGGTDCIIGGGGDDILQGGGGRDVCIGGPGNDTFISCATQIQ